MAPCGALYTCRLAFAPACVLLTPLGGTAAPLYVARRGPPFLFGGPSSTGDQVTSSHPGLGNNSGSLRYIHIFGDVCLCPALVALFQARVLRPARYRQVRPKAQATVKPTADCHYLGFRARAYVELYLVINDKSIKCFASVCACPRARLFSYGWFPRRCLAIYPAFKLVCNVFKHVTARSKSVGQTQELWQDIRWPTLA